MFDQQQKQQAFAAAGDGWDFAQAELSLEGWSRSRTVVLFRRVIKRKSSVGEHLALQAPAHSDQLELFEQLEVIEQEQVAFQYMALVTNFEEVEPQNLGNLYRGRSDNENCYDEMKNQWGWSGFTTTNLNRCHLMALFIGLIYN